MRADRHSCLAAPYAPSDPRTARFFELNISKANAPVVCASAGKLKGKAIYADADLAKNTRIWTESPYVGMQHELNKRVLPSCQYCFVPLLGDYKQQWTDMAAQWNEHQHQQHQHDADTWPVMATPHDLDEVIQRLHVERRNCGLAGAAIRCVCGDAYCSKLCQIRAYHEFHAVLCPRDDPFSAMSVLMRHASETNDIFLLVAKVIARVLSRFLVTENLVKAREPMDMFHKKPWWEVVMMEKHVQRRSTETASTSSSSSGGDDVEGLLPRQRGQTLAQTAGKASSFNGKRRRRSEEEDDHEDDEDEDDDDDAQDSDQSPRLQQQPFQLDGESEFLKDLLVSTHQLLLDALESNLVHLEREDQLHGHSVNELWTSCASILSFEFFAAQLGLFEMNNIRVEVDHPFHALLEILDQGEDIEEEENETTPPTNPRNSTNPTPTPTILSPTPTKPTNFSPTPTTPRSKGEQELFKRVRDVLAFGEHERVRHQFASLQCDGLDASATLDDVIQCGSLRGFPSFDGTALFSIICTMNHSCDPNCTVLYTKNGDAHVVAVRNIEKGEELCICYIDVDQSVRERDELLKDYQFRCICPRCISERRELRHQHQRDAQQDGGKEVEDEEKEEEDKRTSEGTAEPFAVVAATPRDKSRGHWHHSTSTN